MDGNFAMAPGVFSQLNIICVPLGNNYVTLVSVLLPNKYRETYQELLQALVNKRQQPSLPVQLDTIMTDFEDAVLRSVQTVWEQNASRQGCFYQLIQSTCQKIQDLDLTNPYNTDEEFQNFVGMLDGLAFLPLPQVQAGMQVLRNIAPNEAQDLLDYFDSTYVFGLYRQRDAGGLVMNLRHAPTMFPPELWNQHDATVNGNLHTNNICEGCNNKFRNLVGRYHSTVWTCVQ
uniref:MULE transposase domain-containing protein n=1 Tax=Octopus bimaculoides TaxID=37653 RepID=A0A0L8HB40_OCTBM